MTEVFTLKFEDRSVFVLNFTKTGDCQGKIRPPRGGSVLTQKNPLGSSYPSITTLSFAFGKTGSAGLCVFVEIVSSNSF